MREMELQNACQAFESYFLQIMFREMRKTTGSGTFLPKSHAENIFQDMLDEEYAKLGSNSFGLANAMMKQLTRTNS